MIRGHPHSQILNTHNISSLTISNNPKKNKKCSLLGNVSESPAKLFKIESQINDVSQHFQEKQFVNTITDARDSNTYTQNIISNWIPAISATNYGESSEVEPILGLESEDIVSLEG